MLKGEPQQIHHNKPSSSFYYFIGKHGLVPDDESVLVHPVLPPKKTPRRTTHDAVSPGHPRDRNVSTGHLAAGWMMS